MSTETDFIPSVGLPVKLILQPGNHTCAPTCLKMVLNYVRDNLKVKVREMDIFEIANTIGTTVGGGTKFEKVSHINKKLLKSSREVAFQPDEGHNFEEITRELEQSRPVIAWLIEGERHAFGHSVVITHYSKTTLKVHYLDPITGYHEKDVTVFMTQWQRQNNILIKLKISTRANHKIEEFHNGD